MNLNGSSNLSIVRNKVEAALKEVGDELGISFKMGRITYDGDGSNARCKLDMNRIGESGVVETKERKDFARYAPLAGVDAGWLDQTFESQGETFRVTGWNTRAHKMPVQGTSVSDGRKFKFSASTLRSKTLKTA